MTFPKEINVTEQMVDISHLSAQQITYYQELTKELKKLYLKNGAGRQIFTLSGPAGSGKSVIASILENLLADTDIFTYINAGLDAFHYQNSTLEKLGLLSHKGRYDTYNTELLYHKMSAFMAGDAVLLPYYSRTNHNPVEDKILVTSDNVLLLMEGQWFLRDSVEWSKVRGLSAYNLYVKGPAKDIRENVIKRHIAGGSSIADAENFYTVSDLVNTQEMSENSVEPDQEIVFYKNI